MPPATMTRDAVSLTNVKSTSQPVGAVPVLRTETPPKTFWAKTPRASAKKEMESIAVRAPMSSSRNCRTARSRVNYG
ncbi:hypothetical protein PpBr36_04438 [Pyricularia pennisetigena]|uniref:hypothetical protein n=1 Tax=Pyricularia pennisetigena TaxID=1578925 RepID=UPI00114F756D|nr:hypothetical protein PpBr36_04438 [Pyricularia pennisetigena]TLS27470.1 hypothetical protein PpBr36_04438 [Pyricularia pennisetigena]